ncbi:MAG TPA: hypothetical protein VLE51_03210 [Candidatus Saccharimonadales bacterium]|nr:hypothetical protein [Candidatus Saccharimonadales bacterium]
MQDLLTKMRASVKPVSGFSHFIHLGLNILLPILAYVLVRIDFVSLAILLILLAKWRIFAVRPRYWLVNIASNGIDILVGISLVLFMSSTSVTWWQLFWMGLYIAWLVWLKPRSDVLSVSAQAMIGQLLGLSVLYLKFGDAPLATLVFGTWSVTYLSARHFLSSFEESRTGLLTNIWAYFAASLAFVLGHWLLFYGSISQILIILTTIGYSLAALYYLDASERLSATFRRQILAIMCAILIIIVVLSDWTGATV